MWNLRRAQLAHRGMRNPQRARLDSRPGRAQIVGQPRSLARRDVALNRDSDLQQQGRGDGEAEYPLKADKRNSNAKNKTMRRGTCNQIANLRACVVPSLVLEQQLYTPAFKAARHDRVDHMCGLIETCVGSMGITAAAPDYAYIAGEPVDLLTGWDLRDPHDVQAYQSYVRLC